MMFGWLKKKGPAAALQTPETPTPSAADFPFLFPIVEEDVDSLTALLVPRFGLCPKKNLATAAFPNRRVHSVDGSVWRISGSEMVALGPRLFDQETAYVRYAYTKLAEETDLGRLRALAQRLTEEDPDDIWNQVVSHERLIDLVRQCKSLGELARVVATQGGE